MPAPLSSKKSDFAPYVVLTGRRSAFVGQGFDFGPQRNAVATIVVGLDHPVRLTDTGDTVGQPRRSGWVQSHEGDRAGALVVLPPESSGRLVVEGRVALLFSDPLVDDLSRIAIDAPSLAVQRVREALMQGPGRGGRPFLDPIFRMLEVGERRPRRADIARVVQAMSASPERFDRLTAAADLAGLSPARFRHVFADVVGLTFTRFRQWRRMGAVVRQMAEGRPLTDAAHVAGFAGSAHLATAFRAMFGLSPSQLTTAGTRYVLDAPPIAVG
ncbi:MAG: AraC family transcriptional regulator [Myxococcota bacterium]